MRRMRDPGRSARCAPRVAAAACRRCRPRCGCADPARWPAPPGPSLGAADASSIEVVGDEQRRVVGDQVGDRGLVGMQLPMPVAQALGHAEFDAARCFRAQRGIAVVRVIQFVERGRLECGAGVRGDAQAMRGVDSPREAAGVVAAELVVVIVPQRRLRPNRPWYCTNPARLPRAASNPANALATAPRSRLQS